MQNVIWFWQSKTRWGDSNTTQIKSKILEGRSRLSVNFNVVVNETSILHCRNLLAIIYLVSYEHC